MSSVRIGVPPYDPLLETAGLAISVFMSSDNIKIGRPDSLSVFPCPPGTQVVENVVFTLRTSGLPPQRARERRAGRPARRSWPLHASGNPSEGPSSSATAKDNR